MRCIWLRIETTYSTTSEDYEATAHAIWDRVEALLSNIAHPMYTGVKEIEQLECEASYAPLAGGPERGGIVLEVLMHLAPEERVVADLSKTRLRLALKPLLEGKYELHKRVVPPPPSFLSE